MSFGLISPAFLCDTALAGLRACDCVRVSVRFVCTSGHVHRCTAHHTRACQVEEGIPVGERTNKPGAVCGACNAAAFEATGRSFFKYIFICLFFSSFPSHLKIKYTEHNTDSGECE